jgi:hypothetical protein
MIYVLSSCTVVMGKKKEFESAFREISSIYERHGAKLIGLWWTIGGEANEAVWIHSWKDLKDFERGQEEVWEDKDFPMEKVASTMVTYTDRILKPSALSPLK